MKKFLGMALVLVCGLTLAACSSTKKESKSSDSSTATSSKVEEKTSKSSTTASSTKASAPAKTTGDFVENAADSNFDGKMLRGNSYSVRITATKVIPVGQPGNEYGEKPVLAFWYDTLVAPNYDNSTPIDPSTAWMMNFEAVQDNNPNSVNKLEIGSLPDDKFLDTQMEEIKPGGTVQNAVAYELTDLVTPVKLTAKDMLGTEYGNAEFPVK